MSITIGSGKAAGCCSEIGTTDVGYFSVHVWDRSQRGPLIITHTMIIVFVYPKSPILIIRAPIVGAPIWGPLFWKLPDNGEARITNKTFSLGSLLSKYTIV